MLFQAPERSLAVLVIILLVTLLIPIQVSTRIRVIDIEIENGEQNLKISSLAVDGEHAVREFSRYLKDIEDIVLVAPLSGSEIE